MLNLPLTSDSRKRSIVKIKNQLNIGCSEILKVVANAFPIKMLPMPKYDGKSSNSA